MWFRGLGDRIQGRGHRFGSTNLADHASAQLGDIFQNGDRITINNATFYASETQSHDAVVLQPAAFSSTKPTARNTILVDVETFRALEIQGATLQRSLETARAEVQYLRAALDSQCAPSLSLSQTPRKAQYIDKWTSTDLPSQQTVPSTQTHSHKIIIGIDYGTTYSGIAWVTSNKSSHDIVSVTHWPGHRNHAHKVPSLIAYASENLKSSRDHWGFEVSRNLKSYAWTKLLLDKGAEPSQYDDPLLRQMYGADSFLALPADKTAEVVVEDFLSAVYKYAISTLERELSADVLASLPMECWVTVPAIWSDAAQLTTRKAAMRAGFGSRPFDSVSMVTEPEAATLYALQPYLGKEAIEPLRVGEHILVADCGGGTVDMITYEIMQVQPRLQHREKCAGTGAKCGGTAIDRAFIQWMVKQFGKAFTGIDVRKRGPGSLFMQSFESSKRWFGSRDGEAEKYEIGPIAMDLDTPSLCYDEDEQTVYISHREMISLFNGTVEIVIAKLNEQRRLLSEMHCRINRLVVVGGFGDSPYLQLRLRAWSKQNGIKNFVCPKDGQLATVKGAVMRGLEQIRPLVVIARRHYGWNWGRQFREGIDDGHESYIDDWDGLKYCRDRMEWVILKGQELDSEYKSRRKIPFSRSKINDSSLGLHELQLYSCSADHAPDWNSSHGVRKEGTITTNLRGSKLLSQCNPKTGKWVNYFCYEIEITFRSEDGTLGFKSFRDGKEAAATSISFAE